MVLGAEPVRTCVGCRNRAPASTLLRVVATVDATVPAVLPDPRRRLPGRGAYLHVDPGCLAKAERRRAFARALRVAGILDTEALASYVSSHAGSAAAQVPGQTDGGRESPPGQQGRTTDMSNR